MFIKTTPFTHEDIIYFLQRYKTAWSKIFSRSVYLDYRDGEIHVYESVGGSRYDKSLVLNQMNFRRLGLEEILPELYTIKLVEEWLDLLSEREREAIFWRFINHDGEPASVEDEINVGIRFKTLSWAEIAARMGVDSSTVRIYVDRAFSKILESINKSMM